jgi:hypothetical protein
MFQSWLAAVVGWVPVFAVAVLAVILAWRRLWRELPFFFLYLVSALLVTIVRYVTFHQFSHKVYFYAFWVCDLFVSVVVFLPMYEVFLRRLFRGFQRNNFYKSIFPLVAFVILVLTVVTAMQAHDKGAAFQMASRAFDFMRTAVLVFFIGLMAFMGRRWTRYDLGITLGFAIQAAVALANSAVRVRMHYRPTFMDTVEIVAYNISCLIWLITFLRPEKRTPLQSAEHLDPEMLHQAQGWEEQLKGWLTARKSKR